MSVSKLLFQMTGLVVLLVMLLLVSSHGVVGMERSEAHGEGAGASSRSQSRSRSPSRSVSPRSHFQQTNDQVCQPCPRIEHNQCVLQPMCADDGCILPLNRCSAAYVKSQGYDVDLSVFDDHDLIYHYEALTNSPFENSLAQVNAAAVDEDEMNSDESLVEINHAAADKTIPVKCSECSTLIPCETHSFCRTLLVNFGNNAFCHKPAGQWFGMCSIKVPIAHPHSHHHHRNAPCCRR